MALQWPLSKALDLKFSAVFLLGVSVIISAVSVVYVQHETRVLHSKLEQLDKEKNFLLNEWSKLLLEQSALTTDVRVESMAKNKLNMEIIKDIKVIKP